jgi:hypothetical protein
MGLPSASLDQHEALRKKEAQKFEEEAKTRKEARYEEYMRQETEEQASVHVFIRNI